MKYIIPLILLFRLAYVDDMQSALREHTNHNGAVMILAQWKIESDYGRAGIAKGNGYNWGNVSCLESYKGKKRMCYEWENGKRVKKFFYVWDTPEIASKAFIAYLHRKYPGAMEAAERMDVKTYVRILHKGGYFTSDAGEYERNMRRAVREGERGKW